MDATDESPRYPADMSQDPYGFPDSSPGAGASEASTAMWLGVSAALLGSVGMCFCYVPYFIALPLGATAAYKGYQVIGASSEVRDRTMATAGLVAGSISALVSAAFCAFIVMYALFFVVYFGFIMAMIGTGALDEPSYDDSTYGEYGGEYGGGYEEIAPAEEIEAIEDPTAAPPVD